MDGYHGSMIYFPLSGKGLESTGRKPKAR